MVHPLTPASICIPMGIMVFLGAFIVDSTGLFSHEKFSEMVLMGFLIITVGLFGTLYLARDKKPKVPEQPKQDSENTGIYQDQKNSKGLDDTDGKSGQV